MGSREPSSLDPARWAHNRRRARRAGRRASISLPLALGAALAGVAWPAWARDGGGSSAAWASATRPELIEQARAAHKAGDHLKAAGLYRRAADISMGPSLGCTLALEQEEAGQLADSYLDAQQCARDATADLKLPDRPRVLRDCQDLELRLAPRIGYIVVEVSDRPAGVDIAVAGQLGGPVTLGLPYVVTPGSITIKARATGRIMHWTSVEVAPGETKTLKIALTPMPDGSGPLTAAQKQEIREHYQRASRDYDLGKFADAIDEYQTIYEIDGDPVMLYNLAQAYRLSDQPDRALQFYRRYLERAPDAHNRDAVDQKIAALLKLIADRGKGAPMLSP
jgi:tetratricopeptide (TPR) repeat protein